MEKEEKGIVEFRGIDIQSVDLRSVEATLRKVSEFQNIIRNTLKEGHDYGIIPGASKPTLLKPGAEKILMVFGLTSRYELLEEVRDYEAGFFAFTVRCSLEKAGIPITQGLGHANTREKRYVSGKQQDPWILANTVLKMAKKRALVDASLTVASLSEIFTQDLEDYEEGFEDEEEHREKKNGGKATERQIQLIINLLKHYVRNQEGEGEEAYRKRIEEVFVQKYGKNINELSVSEASRFIEKLKPKSQGKEEAPF